MPNCSPTQMLLTFFSKEPTFSGLTWVFSPQKEKTLQVIVDDRNDNAPVFKNTADFSTNVSEVTSALTGCVFVCGGVGRREAGILETLLRVEWARDSQQEIQDWEKHLLEGAAARTKFSGM